VSRQANGQQFIIAKLLFSFFSFLNSEVKRSRNTERHIAATICLLSTVFISTASDIAFPRGQMLTAPCTLITAQNWIQGFSFHVFLNISKFHILYERRGRHALFRQIHGRKVLLEFPAGV
jgi:hypothetical protein